LNQFLFNYIPEGDVVFRSKFSKFFQIIFSFFFQEELFSNFPAKRYEILYVFGGIFGGGGDIWGIFGGYVGVI
jgi:hypothetical protein